jgi:hypothetical protein
MSGPSCRGAEGSEAHASCGAVLTATIREHQSMEQQRMLMALSTNC